VPLGALDPGTGATVKFISEELEEDSELLNYLDQHDIKPGCAVRVSEKAPATGVVLIETQGGQASLAVATAARIRVLVRPD
jgi:hypothetical protein